MKKRKTRRNRTSGALALTSLMDVLTIILLFLLVNYSDNVVQADLPKNMELPTVASDPGEKLDKGITVEVDERNISLDGQVVAHGNGHYRDRLVASVTHMFKQQGNKKDRPVVIKADKGLSYEVIDIIVESAASAGWTKIDFMALAKEEG